MIQIFSRFFPAIGLIFLSCVRLHPNSDQTASLAANEGPSTCKVDPANSPKLNDDCIVSIFSRMTFSEVMRVASAEVDQRTS
jgi:hypothetical protein